MEKKTHADFTPPAKPALIAAALGCLALGAVVGFVGQALIPVKTLAALPAPVVAGKTPAEPLPDVFWLKKGTAKTLGNFRAKERGVLAGRPLEVHDREITGWINDAFPEESAPTEDLDASIGAPFVRIGGQRPGTESDPVLTVTTPFKVKFGALPVTEIPLQFVARPEFDGKSTVWHVSSMRAGHAKIPDALAASTAARAIREILSRPENQRGEKLLEKLAAYRSVTIRDHKVILALPLATAP